ncbi:MAG: cyclodeaminase/cyclohydrolase family protein [Bacteroidota bacterium]
MLTEKTVDEFLDELASDSPAPGGGSVAALAGATGAALTAMVCRLTIGKKKYAEVQEEMESILQEAEELRRELTRLVDEDTEAFNRVMAAFGLPKETTEQQERRAAAIQEATREATLVPLRVMKLVDRSLPLAVRVAEKGNKNSASDAGVAALMLQAACSGAALNVRTNLGSLKDESFVRETTGQVKEIVQRVEAGVMETLAYVNKIVLS